LAFVAAAICVAARVAVADPSADCRNLASWFGSRPETLDVQSLAALSTCVTREIQVRAASPGAVPSADPQTTDSSSGGQSSSQTEGTWGTWPTTPAWKDQAIESKPWDSWGK
jgi:hypothetical protein